MGASTYAEVGEGLATLDYLLPKHTHTIFLEGFYMHCPQIMKHIVLYVHTSVPLNPLTVSMSVDCSEQHLHLMFYEHLFYFLYNLHENNLDLGA